MVFQKIRLGQQEMKMAFENISKLFVKLGWKIKSKRQKQALEIENYYQLGFFPQPKCILMLDLDVSGNYSDVQGQFSTLTGGMSEVTISDDVDTFVQQVTPANLPCTPL